MGKKYILDANTIIDYVGDKLPLTSALAMDRIIDEELNISVIAKIEVLGFNGSESEMRRLRDFVTLSTIIYIDKNVANQTIALRKARKMKLPDAIIAATAMANSFKLLSRNTKDFDGIDGLEVVNPYTL